MAYNTFTNFQATRISSTDELDYKWNFAYWIADDIGHIGGENELALASWVDANRTLSQEVIPHRGKFQDEFIQVVIKIAQRLFTEKVIEKKFGKNIPIIVHDLEYYDEPIHWTVSANPPELIEEFLRFAKNQ